MKLTTQGWMVAVIAALPWFSLLLLGLIWLWQHDALLIWLGLLAGSSLLGWLFVKRLASLQQEVVREKPKVEAEEHWLDQDREIWREVDQLAESQQIHEYPLDNQLPHRLLDVGIKTTHRVARHYHPGADKPLLEISLPHLLKIIELASRDLRRNANYLPFSHGLSINQLLYAPKLFNLASQAYDTYRLGMLFINPANAALNELKRYFLGQINRYPRDELLLWFIQNYIREVGRYAINLYSGKLLLEEDSLKAAMKGEIPLETEDKPDRLEQEPLRILVLGQTNSGKSSLINALFGELRVWTDSLPLTDKVTPYLLERDGVPQVIILDTVGYAGPEGQGQAEQNTVAEILRCDLVLLVCSAVNAARQADRRLLEHIVELFRQRPDLSPPPLVCVLSHVDRLSPAREWQPPYNIVEPDSPKARRIREAVDSVAGELGLDPADVVPVNLRPAYLYNVDEGVIPTLQAKFPPARKAQYLRALRQARQSEFWEQLGQQAGNLGQILLRGGSHLRKRWFG